MVTVPKSKTYVAHTLAELQYRNRLCDDCFRAVLMGRSLLYCHRPHQTDTPTKPTETRVRVTHVSEREDVFFQNTKTNFAQLLNLNYPVCVEQSNVVVVALRTLNSLSLTIVQSYV